MDRDRYLELVRDLTHTTVEHLHPAGLEDFADDFADWTLNAGTVGVAEKGLSLSPAPGLDTTLVAGMFFQVMVEANRLPASTPERVSFVRKRAKDYLVNRLAGQITLSQFYRLLNIIEEKVGLYFEHLEWTGPKPTPREELPAAPLAPEPVKAEELRQALAKLDLPQKGRRKLTPETLWDFLRHTRGGWFKLLDFEARFGVNKKTAWSYLNLLHQKGILQHNHEKANKVRYILAPPFLSLSTAADN